MQVLIFDATQDIFLSKTEDSQPVAYSILVRFLREQEGCQTVQRRVFCWNVPPGAFSSSWGSFCPELLGAFCFNNGS